ncbi:MAG TPA: endo-1,4-beta-xylanase [Phycisphaerae bacterium]|nr:endo-1,4-beta-xylanase [Phycisphaerae bacterium]
MDANIIEPAGMGGTSAPGLHPHAPSRPAVPLWIGLALCLLLAVAQIAIAGYQLGVGNQSIQIAFVKAWANPTLFANDDMVRQTMPLYPSYFFRALAPLAHTFGIAPLYLALQLLTSFLTLAAVYVLGRSIFRSHAAALAAVALLLAGHHQALAGDGLYSAGFTHTYFALPLALFALALAYRRRMIAAAALLGILFNIHALTAAYALLMIAAALLADFPWRRDPAARTLLRRWLLHTSLAAAAFLLLALPTLLQMASQHQSFDAQWIHLMRVRSADHSFPSTWWAAGDPDLPRFVLVFALFVLSWSFAPVRWHGFAARTARVTLFMTAAILALFAAGYLFSEILPWPTMIRLQPFRASRLLLALMLIHIAHASVMAIRAGWTGQASRTATDSITLALPARIAEITGGIFVLLTLAIPALLPLLPAALAVALIVALISGRLWWGQALIAAAALIIALLAYLQINFPLPGLSHDWLGAQPGHWHAPLAWLPLLLAIALALTAALTRRRAPRAAVGAAAALAGLILAAILYAQLLAAPAPDPALADISAWAQSQTDPDALFLTPTGMANFRIDSDRPIVGDWRDGTQLYFSAAFAPDWLARIRDLEPHLMLSPDDSRLIARGDSLDSLDDQQLLALAKKYDADYILLPNTPGEKRSLAVAHANKRYTLYKPEVAVVANAPKPPEGVINPVEWAAMERFMNTTVADNIEKYRKADLTLQIVDAAGLPVQNADVTLEQTSHAFHFGMSLGFFEPNNIIPGGDEKPAPVTQKELDIAPTIFNASMIPFSGKWCYVEPTPNDMRWSDLDKYVDFATQHHMTLEYHYLSGIQPAYVRANPTQAEFDQHALAIVGRYADRIKYWQVENEGNLLRLTPEVFKLLHQKFPNIKLGMSDCIRLWDGDGPGVHRGWDQWRGWDDFLWLKSQGVKIDFFGAHGHNPAGLWSDPREEYQILDRFQKEGVRVHLTEEYLPPVGYNIIGPVRRGQWTPELRAEYFVRYLTVAFSHPDVDFVNLWGMTNNGWGPSGGMENPDGSPGPALAAINKLLHQTWHTHVQQKTGLDGKITTRAFHGSYDISITTPDGQTTKSTLTIPQSPTASLRLTLSHNTLTPSP